MGEKGKPPGSWAVGRYETRRDEPCHATPHCDLGRPTSGDTSTNCPPFPHTHTRTHLAAKTLVTQGWHRISCMAGRAAGSHCSMLRSSDMASGDSSHVRVCAAKNTWCCGARRQQGAHDRGGMGGGGRSKQWHARPLHWRDGSGLLLTAALTRHHTWCLPGLVECDPCTTGGWRSETPFAE